MRLSMWFIILAVVLVIAGLILNNVYFALAGVVSVLVALLIQNDEIKKRRDGLR